MDNLVTLPAQTNVSGNIDVTHAANLDAGSQTLQLFVTGGAVVVNEIRVVPLRTTSRVDPATPSFLSASSCAGSTCHTDQFNQWRSSMMGYSSISPPIHALELTENHVSRAQGEAGSLDPAMGFGRFARTRSPASPPVDQVHQEGQLFCQKCHAPAAVYTDVYRAFDDFSYDANNRGTVPDSHTLLRQLMDADPLDPLLPLRGGALPSDPTELALLKANAQVGTEGINCLVCHSINGIDRSKNAPNLDPNSGNGPRPTFEDGVANAAFRVNHDPDGSSYFNRMQLGPYDDFEVDAAHAAGKAGGDALVITGTDGEPRPFIRTGEFCGTCHDVRIPFSDEGTNGQLDYANGQYGNGDEAFRRVENLFSEWRDGPWNNNAIAFAQSSTQKSFTNPGRMNAQGVKTVTTCQDCHMSKFVTDDSAVPGVYEMGAIAGSSNVSRRRSNHRFIGVDRFLTHDAPTPSDTSINDLLSHDIALGVGALTGVDPIPECGSPPVLPCRTVAKEPEFAANIVPGRDIREILLQKAFDFRIEHVGHVQAGQLPVTVSVENIGAGHNIPAGLSQERQIWIELEVLDDNDENVYTSGYLNFIEGPDAHAFNPFGAVRYKDSACASMEYECDLDSFRVAQLGPYLNILPGNPLGAGQDAQLKNYQNGFSRDGSGLDHKVFTQFIADHIVNTNSLKPFEKHFEQYTVSVGPRTGPFKVNARLRFRPLPFEFLKGLQNSMPTAADCANSPGQPCYPSRVTDDVIQNNVVINVKHDECVANAYGLLGTRACNRTNAPLALGDQTSCAVFGKEDGTPSGSLQCFGSNASGAAGVGVGPGALATPSVLSLLDVSMAALGATHGCALLNDGTVSCWGDGSGGKLADNSTSSHSRTAPRLVSSLYLSDVSAIASGASTSCALTRATQQGDERVKCWGQGTHGELGDFNASSHGVGVPYTIQAGSLTGVESISAGQHHYCAIANGARGAGSVKCWGQAKGIGRNIDFASPIEPLTPLPYQATKLATGDNFSCALTRSNEVYCWGDNQYGTLGNGSTTDSLAPVKVMLPSDLTDPRPIDLAAGQNHVCALLSDKSVRCWGRGDDGRLGDGNLAAHNQLAPLAIAGLSDVAFVAAGGRHSCAVTIAGERRCWGANNVGQLGLGNFNSTGTPQLVTFADPAVTGRTYYAPAAGGGFGTAECTAPPGFGKSCDDVQTYIDLNENTGYRFTVQSDGGPTQLFPKIAVNSGTRSMNLFVNNVFVQVVQSTSGAAPRPTGAELGPFNATLSPGYNTVEFRDISGSVAEFDILSLRVAGAAGHCYNLTRDVDETDVDCGGATCSGCDAGQVCEFDVGCLSGSCVAGVCEGSGGGGGSPCAGLCSNPQGFSFTWNYQSGNLGTGAICRETNQDVLGGNCGNFANGRTLSVNGVVEPCNNQNWPSLPAPRNGGYCIQTTAGPQDYAYVTLFE
jgi:alpha-tubulin suppressor-like RCC1 family protein